LIQKVPESKRSILKISIAKKIPNCKNVNSKNVNFKTSIPKRQFQNVNFKTSIPKRQFQKSHIPENH